MHKRPPKTAQLTSLLAEAKSTGADFARGGSIELEADEISFGPF